MRVDKLFEFFLSFLRIPMVPEHPFRFDLRLIPVQPENPFRWTSAPVKVRRDVAPTLAALAFRPPQAAYGLANSALTRPSAECDLPDGRHDQARRQQWLGLEKRNAIFQLDTAR